MRGLGERGVIAGNLAATLTLGALALIVSLLLATVIFGPLIHGGLPRLNAQEFSFAVLFFALIGAGYMFVQIGFMQRFSVYLGHPIYAVSITLFSMILATGVGSAVSDRIPLESRRTWAVWLPPVAASVILGVTLLMQSTIRDTIQFSLLARCLVVVAFVTPPSLMMGFFFPVGMRLVGRLSTDATPWMWGVNGAAGVLASVGAVAVSMWFGIQTTFYLAISAYALLTVAASMLWRREHGRA